MANTYRWVVSSMDCKIKETVDGTELDDVVNMVHWRRQAKSAGTWEEPINFADVYGALSLDSPDPTDFTLYASLTQVEVEAWLEAGMDMVELKDSLDAQIALLKNPVEETKPNPWVV